MKVKEIIAEGWWDDLKSKIVGKLGPAGDPDINQSLDRFNQNVQGRVQPAYQEWISIAKHTQLPEQPGEEPAVYQKRRAQYLSGAIKQFADQLYKKNQPQGGTRIPTPAFTGNEGPDLQAAKNYLTNRTKEYFTTINFGSSEVASQPPTQPAQAPAPQSNQAVTQVRPQTARPAAKTSTVPARQFRPAGGAVAPARPQPTPPREKYMGPAQQVQPQQLQSPVRRLPR
jgi:hypothetical protein